MTSGCDLAGVISAMGLFGVNTQGHLAHAQGPTDRHSRDFCSTQNAESDGTIFLLSDGRIDGSEYAI